MLKGEQREERGEGGGNVVELLFAFVGWCCSGCCVSWFCFVVLFINVAGFGVLSCL